MYSDDYVSIKLLVSGSRSFEGLTFHPRVVSPLPRVLSWHVLPVRVPTKSSSRVQRVAFWSPCHSNVSFGRNQPTHTCTSTQSNTICKSIISLPHCKSHVLCRAMRIIIQDSDYTLESRWDQLTERFFQLSVLPETSCLRNLLPEEAWSVCWGQTVTSKKLWNFKM